MRSRKRISYREPKDEEGEGSEDDEELVQPEPSKPDIRKAIKPHPHYPLFKMVLNTMHDETAILTDQPRLSELAAVCSEVLEREKRPDPVVFINTLVGHDDRKNQNVTPTSFVIRDAPTPPSTPLMAKQQPFIRPYSGAIYAPIPTQPHHKPYAYSGYFAPNV
jgi:hypothetical protein